MRLCPFACAAALSICSITFAAAAPASEGMSEPQKMSYLHGQIEDSLKIFDAQLADDKQYPETRNYTFCAYYGLLAGRTAAQSEALIRTAVSEQIMDPASPDYGTVPWNARHTEIKDTNSIEFAMISLGPVLTRYREKFSSDFLTEMKPHIEAGIVAVRNHKVLVSYTNIFTMRFTNLVLLGESLGDEQAVKDGLAALDTWLDFTRVNGVSEFCSPTYTSVAIDNLQMLYRNTKSQAVKDRAKIGLDYIWLDTAASTFVNAGLLGGAHSRSYNFLDGDGSINRFLWMNGLRSAAPGPTPFSSGMGAYPNATENGYRPSAELLAVGIDHPSRVVQMRAGEPEGHDRYTIFTPGFAMGSDSCAYNHEDLQIAFQFANPTNMPHVAVYCDPIDGPYGMSKSKDKSGHIKPHHVTTAIACVQDHGSLLALLNPAKDLKSFPTTSLSTAIVFPLDVDELRIDDKAVKYPRTATTREADDWSMDVTSDAVLALRKGDAACAIRLFDVHGLDNFAPKASLKIDGSRWGAGRLAMYQYQGPQKKFEIHEIRSGVLMLASEIHSPSDFDQLIRRAHDAELSDLPAGDHEWTVKAVLGDHSLQAALDLQTGVPSGRMIDGKPFERKTFDIDGKNPAEAIWAELDHLRNH